VPAGGDPTGCCAAGGPLSALNATVLSLKTQVTTNTGDLGALQGTVATHTSQIAALQAKDASLAADIASVNTSIRASVSTLQTQVNNITAIQVRLQGKGATGRRSCWRRGTDSAGARNCTRNITARVVRPLTPRGSDLAPLRPAQGPDFAVFDGVRSGANGLLNNLGLSTNYFSAASIGILRLPTSANPNRVLMTLRMEVGSAIPLTGLLSGVFSLLSAPTLTLTGNFVNRNSVGQLTLGQFTLVRTSAASDYACPFWNNIPAVVQASGSTNVVKIDNSPLAALLPGAFSVPVGTTVDCSFLADYLNAIW
jgi:hypothetical protein